MMKFSTHCRNVLASKSRGSSTLGQRQLPPPPNVGLAPQRDMTRCLMNSKTQYMCAKRSVLLPLNMQKKCLGRGSAPDSADAFQDPQLAERGYPSPYSTPLGPSTWWGHCHPIYFVYNHPRVSRIRYTHCR